MVGPEDLFDVIGRTVIGRPDIDRIHEPQLSSVIQTAERARPHMVVIDLPRPEAAQVARRLRDDPATRPTAIVWLNRSEPPDVETELRAAGVDALLEDRDERPGVLFADMDLLGIPHRVVLSDKGLAAGTLEFKGRRDAQPSHLPLSDAVRFLQERLAEG